MAQCNAMQANQQTPSVHYCFEPSSLRHCISLLQTCTKSLSIFKQIHAHALRTCIPISHPLLARHLIFSLASLSPSPLRYVHAIFSQLTHPTVFICNTMIRVYAESAHPAPALDIHRKMLHTGVSPDMHTYPFLIKACAKLMSLRDGEVVQGKVVRLGMERLVFVQNALVHFYCSCGVLESAYKVFEGITERKLVTWNSIINGLAANGRANEVLALYREMIIAGRVDPNGFTMVGLLTACAELGVLALGKRVHVYLVKAGLNRNSHVGNALIDLYAKCGLFDDAHKVFDEMGRYRNVVSWNSLIVGLAVNGYGKQALDLFAQMERENLVPTDITMIGVLYACSHCGLVDDGLMYFDQMKSKYNITPQIEHFGCMVDLLGRCGKVNEAYNYILKMPIEPSAVVWRTLLGTCTMHKKLDIGLTAWARLVEVDPGHSGDYVLLSNLYAAVGQWSQVQKLRKEMLSGGVRKNPGRTCSMKCLRD